MIAHNGEVNTLRGNVSWMRARERALALQPALSLLPLYAQGVRLAASSRITGLDVDGYGVPRLDDAFFSP
jgi:hypothetical protein